MKEDTKMSETIMDENIRKGLIRPCWICAHLGPLLMIAVVMIGIMISSYLFNA